MKRLLVLALLLSSPAWATDLYFGRTDPGAETAVPTVTPRTNGNKNLVWTCPGPTGATMTLKGLHVYAKSNGGTAGNVRIAAYTLGWARIGEGAAELSVSSTTAGWVGHTGAGLTVDTTMTAGQNYKLVFSRDSNDVIVYHDTIGTSQGGQQNSDFTAGFPLDASAQISVGENTEKVHTIRATVEQSYAGAPTSITEGTATDTTIGMTWTVDATATAYDVNVCKDSSYSVNCVTVNVPTNTGAATVTGLGPGTDYYVRIRSLSNALVGAYASYGSPTAMATEAGPPRTFHVDPTHGNDSNDGLTPATAWKTIAKANASTEYVAYDILALERGEVFSDATLTLPAMPDNFTVEAYGTGAKPRFDGNIIRPIYFDFLPRVSNLTVRNIASGGCDWVPQYLYAITFSGITGLVVDGVDFDNNLGSTEGYMKGGLQIWKPQGTVEVKNCTGINVGDLNIANGPTDGLGDGHAFHIYQAMHDTATISFHDNVCHDVQSQCLQFNESTAHAEIFYNSLSNGGESPIALKCGSNADVHHNEFFRKLPFTGYNASGGGGGWRLIQIVPCESETMTSDNNRIHHNYFYDSDDGAIYVGGRAGLESKDNWIYANRFDNMVTAFDFQSYQSGTRFFYNLITNPRDRANRPDQAAAIEENSSGANTTSEITNNTIIRGANQATVMIRLVQVSANPTIVKNNVIVQNSAAAGDICINYPGGTAPTISHNLCYNALSTSRNRYNGTEYTTSNWATWVGAHTGELSSDPLLSPLYTLTGTSPARNAGDATVWAGTADVFDLAGRRITDGVGTVVAPGGVDRGAYEAYTAGGLTKQWNVILRH